MNSQELYLRAQKLINGTYSGDTWITECTDVIRGYALLGQEREAYAFIEYDGVKFTQNQSRIVQHANCKRKYYWIFELNLAPDKPQYALDVGKAAHEALAALNDGRDTQSALQAAADSFDKSMSAVKFMPGEDAFAAEHRAKLLHMLQAYVDYYQGEDEWVVLQPEVQGTVEVGEGTGCFLTFRTDAIVTWRQRIWLLEHKTMAQNRMDNWIKYEMDFQVTAYIYAISKLLGVRVAGVIVNGLVKTKIPQFDRQIYYRTDDQLREWEMETVEQMREIMWRKQRVANGEDPKMVFYKNTSDCFRYGTCAYRPVCLKDSPTQRLLYVRRPPDYVDDPSLLTKKETPDTGGGLSAPVVPHDETSMPPLQGRGGSDADSGHPAQGDASRTRPSVRWGDLIS